MIPGKDDVNSLTPLHAPDALLASIFGFPDFRPGQAEIVDAVLAGQNCLAIMPTGGGKSLCFQLPALCRSGVTVVVSPLIALMRDQVRALRAAGVEAGALTSGNTEAETEEVFAALDAGRLKLLDVTVFDRLRRAAWWRAPLISTLVGSTLDTLLFFSIAFSAALIWIEPGNDVTWATTTQPLLGVGPVVPFWVSLAVADWCAKITLAIVALLPFRLTVAKLTAKVA